MSTPIPARLVEFILLGPVDDRRQLQDSPLLGDVWIEYGRRPGEAVDLLISPYRHENAGHLAVELDKELAGDEAEVAYVQGLVAARLTFAELVQHVVPKSKWWTGQWREGASRREHPVRDLLLDPDRVAAALAGMVAAAKRWQSEQHATVEISSTSRFVALAALLCWAEEGAQLRSDAEGLDIEINSEFDGELIIARDEDEPLDMGDGLTFTVLGPLQPEVAALHDKHEKWLEDLRRQGKSQAEVLSAYVDASVANLSSLVLLAEAGGKTVLLTGDARGDKVLAGMELAGLLAPGDDRALHVDVLKVPHHGSEHNLEVDFFRRVTADHYVFSGDGEHGNPEREAFEMLLEARGDAPYTLHLTSTRSTASGRRTGRSSRQGRRRSARRSRPSPSARTGHGPSTGWAACSTRSRRWATRCTWSRKGSPT